MSKVLEERLDEEACCGIVALKSLYHNINNINIARILPAGEDSAILM